MTSILLLQVFSIVCFVLEIPRKINAKAGKAVVAVVKCAMKGRASYATCTQNTVAQLSYLSDRDGPNETRMSEIQAVRPEIEGSRFSTSLSFANSWALLHCTERILQQWVRDVRQRIRREARAEE